MPTFPSGHRRRASSASDNSSRAAPRSMCCWPKRNELARLSRGDPTIARGGSTPATSATPTDTSGRSSGTRRPKTPRSDHRRHALAVTGQRGLPRLRVSSEFCTSGHAPRIRRASVGRPVRLIALSELDQVAVRIAEVAAGFRPAVDWRREELGASLAPRLVGRLDVCDADVQEAADAIEIAGRLEGDAWLVVSRSAADLDDDPAVRERADR